MVDPDTERCSHTEDRSTNFLSRCGAAKRRGPRYSIQTSRSRLGTLGKPQDPQVHLSLSHFAFPVPVSACRGTHLSNKPFAKYFRLESDRRDRLLRRPAIEITSLQGGWTFIAFPLRGLEANLYGKSSGSSRASLRRSLRFPAPKPRRQNWVMSISESEIRLVLYQVGFPL
jgi:hypothetical protein